MSLINKMLQDLDMRTDAETGSGTTIIEDLQPANDTPPPRPGKSRKRLLITVPVFVLTLAALATVAVKQDVIAGLWTMRTETAAVITPPVAQADSRPPEQTERKHPSTADNDTHNATAIKETTKAVPVPSSREQDDVVAARQRNDGVKSAAGKTAAQHSVPDASTTAQSKPVKVLRQTTPDLQAQESYQSAVRQYNKGHIGEAERLLHQALSFQPDLAPARTMLASLAVEENRWQDAQQTLLEGMTRQPEHYEYSLQLAQILTNRGDEAEAIGVLENSLSFASTDGEYLGFLATLYQRHDRNANAADLYSMALEQQPLAGKWWLGLGLSLESLHNPQAAINAYIKARLSHSLDSRLQAYASQRIEQLSRQVKDEAAPPQPAG